MSLNGPIQGKKAKTRTRREFFLMTRRTVRILFSGQVSFQLVLGFIFSLTILRELERQREEEQPNS